MTENNISQIVGNWCSVCDTFDGIANKLDLMLWASSRRIMPEYLIASNIPPRACVMRDDCQW